MFHLFYRPPRYPPTLPHLCKHFNLQGPLKMPHSSVALPRFPYSNVLPTPTLPPTPDTLLSGLAAPEFLFYSSSWTVSTPSTGPTLAYTEPRGAFPRRERAEIPHLLRERMGGMQSCTPWCDKTQAGVSHVPQSTSTGGQGESYRS